MSSRRGDYQRSAVYRWEAEHIHSKDISTIPFDQVQAIVDYVWMRAGLMFPPKIRELSRTARHTKANATRLTIRIPSTGISSTVLLHEIAHSMTSDAASEQTHAHRPRFVGVFMTLLCDLIPRFRSRRAEADGHGSRCRVQFWRADPVTSRGGPMTRNGFFKLLVKAAMRAGIADVHPHLLRHGGGFKLVNQGMDTLSLAAYLGHANVQNTKRYARMDAARFDGLWRD
jgi:hypothetical protein